MRYDARVVRRRAVGAAIALATALAAGGCNQIFGLDPADRTDAAIDARVDADESNLDASLGPWKESVPIVAFSTGNDEQDPVISDEGLELYVAYMAPASPTVVDIVVSRRVATNQSWPPPVRVMELSTNVNEMTPRLADNDRVMYLASDRPGGAGGQDVWRSQRSSIVTAWSMPAVVQDAQLNTLANDRTASPCLDETRFIFTSDRDGAEPDLYELVDGVALPIPAASSQAFTEASPFVTEDCLTVYFSSNLAGDQDLYVMSRVSLTADFSPPTRIDELSTTAFFDSDPWVSADGRHIVFSTNRGGGTIDLWEAFR